MVTGQILQIKHGICATRSICCFSALVAISILYVIFYQALPQNPTFAQKV